MPAIQLREAISHTLSQHISLIKQVLAKSMRDAEARLLAVAIVSGSYDYQQDRRSGGEHPIIRAWNKNFRAPPGKVCDSRDDECEIERVWDFVVLNLRYVYDAAEIDTFQTLKFSLLAGGGDCDDMTIAFATLLKHLGFHLIARVISTPDDPAMWVHIYPLVGVPKDNPTRWVPLDATVNGFVPGEEWPDIAKHKDFPL